MLKLIVLITVYSVVNCNDFDDFIDDIFGAAPEDIHNVPTCGGVEGNINGCYECYQCQDNEIRNHRSNGRQVDVMELKNSSCNTKQVCCVTQIDLLSTRSDEECGKNNPDGKPRKRRKSLRSVLVGEYPWRAWVYRKDDYEPLCAATYINELNRALITLASCVEDFTSDMLEVTFVKGAHASPVKDVIFHPNYNHVSGENDIAILKLYSLSSTSNWILPACLPVTGPAHGLPCISISDDDKYINTIIPLKSECIKNDTVCAIAPRGDYVPEKGAGLYCKQQATTALAHVVYGLAIDEHDCTTTYTNVAYFSNWIYDTLK